MDKPALIDLTELKNFSPQEVGDEAIRLSKLSSQGIPVPATAVIPQSALERLAITTGLAEKISQVIGHHTSNVQSPQKLIEIQRLIRHLNVPLDFSKSILAWYHQNHGYIKVTTSSDNHQQPAHHNVSGDANLIDSILTVWSEQLHLDLENQQVQVYAEPIILQRYGEPTSSGYALTMMPGDKNQLAIYSVWGNYSAHHPEILPDELTVDLRTNAVTSVKVTPQYLELKPQNDGYHEKPVLHYKQEELSLDRDVARELAAMLTQIKRSSYDDQLVNWYLENGQLYISRLRDVNYTELDESREDAAVLISGETLQAGIAAGQIVKVNRHNQHLAPGNILVAKNLAPSQLEIVKQASAVICEQGVANPTMFQYLKSAHIPTIINARRATHELKDGQEVIVDANAGRILKPHSQQFTPPPTSVPTMTQVYIAAGNPAQASHYLTPQADGVGILRSEFTYASFGQHPEHAIRSRQRSQLRQRLLTTIKAFQDAKPGAPVIYRSLDLSSRDLNMLAHAPSYEEAEPNPFLGLRGGLKMIRRFELLDFEMEMLAAALKKTTSHLGLLLPFVRTPAEMKLITQHIQRHSNLMKDPNFGLYLQLNTPENVLNLKHYFQNRLDGVVFNARSIHALLHGIDPDNPELYALYRYDHELMRQLLNQTHDTIQAVEYQGLTNQSQPKSMVLIEDQSLELAEVAVEMGFANLIVKPNFVNRVKSRVKEIEEQRLAKL